LKTKKQKKTILSAAAILAVLIAFFTYQYFQKEPELVANLDYADTSFIKEMSEDELLRFLQEQADGDYIRLRLDTSMRFSTEEEIGAVNIQNPPSNDYAMEVVTYIEGEDQKIYESGVIQPRHYVSEGRLLREVDEGSYKTVSTVRFYDEEMNVVGTSSVVGNLTVSGRFDG
jgi:hypothetical protein